MMEILILCGISILLVLFYFTQSKYGKWLHKGIIILLLPLHLQAFPFWDSGNDSGCIDGEAGCPIELVLDGETKDNRSPDEFYKFIVPASQDIAVNISDHNKEKCGSWWSSELCELTLILYPLNSDGSCDTDNEITRINDKTGDFNLAYNAEGGKAYCTKAQGDSRDEYDINVTGTAALEAGISDTSKNENDSPMTFTVALTKASASDVTINYTFSDGTAKKGENYNGSEGSVTIPAGSLSADFDVELYDTHMTTSKTFTVTISSDDIDIDSDSQTATGTIYGSDSEDADENYEGPDICYDSRPTSGFCMFGSCIFYQETTNVRAMVNNLDNIHIQKALTRGIAFMDMFSGIGIEGNDKTIPKDEDQAEKRTWFTDNGVTTTDGQTDFIENDYYFASMFPTGIMYRIGDGATNTNGGHMDKNDTTSYYDKALLKLGLFTQYTHLVTYTKNGVTYQEVLQPCNPDNYGSLESKPVLNQCGVFMGALNSANEVKFSSSSTQNIHFQDTLNTTKITGTSGQCDGGDCTDDGVGSHPMELPSFRYSQKSETVEVPYSMVISDQHVGNLVLTHGDQSEDSDETRHIVFEAPYSKSYGGRAMFIKGISDSDNTSGTYYYVFKRGDYWIEDLQINESKKVVFEVTEGVRFFIKNAANIKGDTLKIGYEPDDNDPSACNDPHFYMYLYDDLTIDSPNTARIKNGYIYAKDTITIKNSGSFESDYTAITADTRVDVSSGGEGSYTFALESGCDATDSNNHELFEACPLSGNNAYLSGPFDAWDTFRHNTDHPPQDRNISTKIANKPFALAIASLNRDNNAYETKNGSGSYVAVAIFKHAADTPNQISDNTFYFDANTTSQIPTTDTEEYNNFKFSVQKAERNAYVGFRFCATYEEPEDGDGYLYTLYPSSNCSGDNVECNTTTSGTPLWHVCASSDYFAVRPQSFKIIPDTSSKVSGKDFNITFRAQDENGDPTQAFNQSVGDTFDVNYTESTAGCITGTFSPEINASWSFSNGEYNATTDYSEIGTITVTISDTAKACQERFASVDCDDEDVDGYWNAENNTSIGSDQVSLTFALDHFEVTAITLKDHHMSGNKNFTYLASQDPATLIEPAMASSLDLVIAAENEKNATTANYNNQCYANNPISLSIAYLINGNTPSANNPGTVSNILYRWYDDNSTANENNGSAALGSSLNIENGSGNALPQAIFNTDHNGTAKLTIQLNFDRKYNAPLNPFTLHISDINISDGSVTDSNDSIAADHNATYLYARAKATKDFYDDITDDNVSTPIMVQVYCDKWPASAANCPQVDVVDGRTAEYQWWIATDHNMSGNNDGNITLTVTSDHGSVSPASVTIGSGDKGVDDTVKVQYTQSAKPYIVNIGFDTTSTATTGSWLIYNKDKDQAPTPFYKVRFINTDDWKGFGERGDVVGGEAYKKKNRRLEW